MLHGKRNIFKCQNIRRHSFDMLGSRNCPSQRHRGGGNIFVFALCGWRAPSNYNVYLTPAKNWTFFAVLIQHLVIVKKLVQMEQVVDLGFSCITPA